MISVGSGVSLKPDSLVAVLSVYGSLQSYSVRSADDLVPVPEGLDPAEAVSMVLNYVTAYQMIHRTGVSLKPDSEELVVVHAASGGVGTALLDILRAEFPKAKVLGTSSPGKKEMVLSHGAQHCDYTSEDFAAKIKQLAPNGAKAIFDAVGSANAIKSYSSLSKDGGLVVYGFTQDVASNSNMLWAILKVASRVFIPAKLAGLFGGKCTADMYVVTQFKDKSLANFKTDLGKLFEMAKEGKLHPEVQAVCSIDEALDVYAFFRKGGSRGKVGLSLVLDYFDSALICRVQFNYSLFWRSMRTTRRSWRRKEG